MGVLDARYRLRGEVNPSQDIVIIGITQRCLNQLGKFPWPRTYHAELIDFLKKAGAKVVVMDIFFSQPDQDPLIDQRFAESIKNAGNCILPVFMPHRISKQASDDNFIHVDNLVESMPDFVSGALSQGHINVIPDADGIYRKAPLAIKYDERLFFSLGIEAVIKFLDISPNEIFLGKDFARLRSKQIPLEDSRFIYINFSDVETRAPRFAFSDVVKGLVPANNFKGKLVFVGQTTQGLPNADILQTPFKEKYGITVQANIANTVLSDFYFKRAPKYKACIVIFLLCFLSCLVMVCIRTWSSTVLTIAGFLTLCAVSIHSFVSKGVIVDFVPLSLAIISGFTGGVLYRIRFADRMVKTKELELDSILQAGIVTADGLKTNKAAEVIIGTLVSSIGVKGLLLRWKNQKTNTYDKKFVYGSAQMFLKEGLAEKEEKLAKDTIRTRKAVLVKNTKKDPHSIICAPLLLKGDVVGVITIFDKLIPGQPQEIDFEEDDLKLLLILAQQTAISLENARLFEEVNELFLSSIKSLAETIDAKDPYTHGHVERVTKAAMAIAAEMGLSDEQKKEIEIGAILHDIGKIGVKDAVLSKPSQLTPEEKEMFDQHPDIGSKIMGPIQQLENMIPIIRHHHESFDGNGYPDKLKGEEIPSGARIIAVADTFDAMTSDRPYRKALPESAARQEINKLSGKQFDPKVVDAFNKAYAKGKIQKA